MAGADEPEEEIEDDGADDEVTPAPKADAVVDEDDAPRKRRRVAE